MNTELKSFSILFAETWENFKARALIILGVLLISTLLVIGGMIVLGLVAAMLLGGTQVVMQQFQQGQFGGMFMVAVAIFVLLVMVLALWSQSATIAVVVDDELGIGAGLKVGWQRIWSMAWILSLAGAIISAGFMLLVVPGIIFAVSLMFALYPLYADGTRGMDAVMASRRYVKGRWWNTFGKLLLIWLIALVLQLIPLVGSFLYFIFSPFLLLFMVAMYRDLKATAVESPGEEGRGVWWLLALVGMLLPIIGILAAVAIPQFVAFSQKGQQQMPQEQTLPQVLPQPVEEKNVPTIAEKSAPSQGSWHDPVGDVAEFGVGRWMDLEMVSVQAGSGMLQVEMQTKFPLTAAFNAASTTAQSFYRFASIYFDTDGDRQTGGQAGEEVGRKVYDFGLDLTLEAPRNEPKKGQIHVSLFGFENGLRTFVGPLSEGEVEVQGNRIKLRIPYEALGVQAGSQVRMSFLETFQEQGSGLSKDKLITL